MKRVLIAAALAYSALFAGSAEATVQDLNALVFSVAPTSGSPTGTSGLDTFKYDCVTTGAQCVPLVELSSGVSPLGTGGSGTGLTVTLGSGGSPVTINGNGAATPLNSAPVVNAVMSHASTTALAASLAVSKTAGSHLADFYCTAITGGSAGFCVAYNAAVPSAGALTGNLVLDFCYFDTTARGCSLSRLPNSIVYSADISILVTSNASPYIYTTGTDTAAIAADYF